MHIVMIFVDGFGLGQQTDNPIYAAQTPNLDRLIGGHYLWGNETRFHDKAVLRPVDATLEVAGIPQSATGQTTLWTGINAAKALGYHLNAYPNEELAKIIAENSIFKRLAEAGKKVTFANAFSSLIDQNPPDGKRKYSASTLCALAGNVRLRRAKDLMAGRAVFQDIINEIMRERGEDVPIMDPFDAGQSLGRLALDYDFTLFEFFQTDVKGHKQLWQESIMLVERIDRFVGGFLSLVDDTDKNIGLILTSDHGNIEDFQVKGHTLNPVPLLCWSNTGIEWPCWSMLEEITPGIVKMLTSGEK